MSKGKFLTPSEARPLYGDIIPAYQIAFAGEPWGEVSKCADKQVRCIGGLSSLAVNEYCRTCGDCPSQPAYEEEELIARFDSLSNSRPTSWYVEGAESGITMAAIAWQAEALTVAEEKYAEVPAMALWLASQLPASAQLMWLDEVFANKELKPRGNLQNFGQFVTGMAQLLDRDVVAYRTIEPRMTSVAERDFGSNATVLKRDQDVPDRRDFVIIDVKNRRQS